jgi:hypothetical protein
VHRHVFILDDGEISSAAYRFITGGLRLFASFWLSPDLKVTDYPMLGMTNVELCRCGARDAPASAVLLATGYGEQRSGRPASKFI